MFLYLKIPFVTFISDGMIRFMLAEFSSHSAVFWHTLLDRFASRVKLKATMMNWTIITLMTRTSVVKLHNETKNTKNINSGILRNHCRVNEPQHHFIESQSTKSFKRIHDRIFNYFLLARWQEFRKFVNQKLLKKHNESIRLESDKIEKRKKKEYY